MSKSVKGKKAQAEEEDTIKAPGDGKLVIVTD